MYNIDMNQTKKIVIVGGGFAGVYAALELKKIFGGRLVNTQIQPPPNLPHNRERNDEIEITLISKENYFLFTPLLHEVATGSVNQSNIIQPLRQILGNNIKFVFGEVLSVNEEQKEIETSRGNIPYDFLLLALGSKNDWKNFEPQMTFGLKTLEDARKLKNHIIACFGRASALPKNSIDRKAELNFIVVGAGPTGIELSAEIEEFFSDLLNNFPEISPSEPKVFLIHRSGRILPRFHKKISVKAREMLTKKQHFTFLLNTEISQQFPESVRLKTGETIPTKTVISAVGVKPNSTNFITKTKASPSGQLIVNQFLQVESKENIFSAGDMAQVPCEKTSWPQSAQAAEASGKQVARNIARLIQGKKLKPFAYKEKGQLVSLGKWKAAAEIFGLPFYGHLAWWVWRTIYLSKIPGLAKKIRVVLDWTIDIFYPRDISRL